MSSPADEASNSTSDRQSADPGPAPGGALEECLACAEAFDRTAGLSAVSQEWLRAESESLLHWAEDRGRMLSAAQLENLIERFWQLENARQGAPMPSFQFLPAATNIDEMATPQENVKAMIARLHEQQMKPLGFRKFANTWIRSMACTQLLNVQLSRWNSAEDARFTVNLGVLMPPLHGQPPRQPHKGVLKEYDCDLRSRIGKLFPENTDHWWQVLPSSEPDELVKDVSRRIEGFALPWFDRLEIFASALVSHSGGDSASVERAIARALEGSLQIDRSKLERIAKARGIQIHE